MSRVKLIENIKSVIFKAKHQAIDDYIHELDIDNEFSKLLDLDNIFVYDIITHETREISNDEKERLLNEYITTYNKFKREEDETITDWRSLIKLPSNSYQITNIIPSLKYTDVVDIKLFTINLNNNTLGSDKDIEMRFSIKISNSDSRYDKLVSKCQKISDYDDKLWSQCYDLYRFIDRSTKGLTDSKIIKLIDNTEELSGITTLLRNEDMIK